MHRASWEWPEHALAEASVGGIVGVVIIAVGARWPLSLSGRKQTSSADLAPLCPHGSKRQQSRRCLSRGISARQDRRLHVRGRCLSIFRTVGQERSRGGGGGSGGAGRGGACSYEPARGTLHAACPAHQVMLTPRNTLSQPGSRYPQRECRQLPEQRIMRQKPGVLAITLGLLPKLRRRLELFSRGSRPQRGPCCHLHVPPAFQVVRPLSLRAECNDPVIVGGAHTHTMISSSVKRWRSPGRWQLDLALSGWCSISDGQGGRCWTGRHPGRLAALRVLAGRERGT